MENFVGVSATSDVSPACDLVERPNLSISFSGRKLETVGEALLESRDCFADGGLTVLLIFSKSETLLGFWRFDEDLNTPAICPAGLAVL